MRSLERQRTHTMDIRFDDTAEAFRHEIRTWLEANVPTEPMPGHPDAAFQYRRDWQRRMYDAGWAGIHWPKAYGGRGATLIEQAVFSQEMARAQAPDMANALGLMIVGPTLMSHGTEMARRPSASTSLAVSSIVPDSLDGASRVERAAQTMSMPSRASASAM